MVKRLIKRAEANLESTMGGIPSRPIVLEVSSIINISLIIVTCMAKWFRMMDTRWHIIS